LLLINASCLYALSTPNGHKNLITRRDIIHAQVTSSAAVLASLPISPSNAATNGLAAKLSQRDPTQLKNSVFNIPPAAQVYPSFLSGTWDVSMKYRGFIFPSTTIPKEKLVQNVDIPGFQKLSIAMVGDIGKETTNYTMSINKLEDRKMTLQSSIDSHLGYEAIRQVIYEVKENPNRISIDFIPQRTRNANRIELFFNGRESELVSVPSQSDGVTRDVFVCSEYIRQVTFGLSQEFGVARQVVGNYAHYWTWRETENKNIVTGNLLTAGYLDAQDPMFFQEPSKPVVVYSHDLVGSRVNV